MGDRWITMTLKRLCGSWEEAAEGARRKMGSLKD
jgi:hypothetical protein